MASAQSASLYGGLGAKPPVGSRGKAPGGGQGAKPPEAVHILRSRSMNFALEMHDFPICITVQIFVIMQYYDGFTDFPFMRSKS